MKVPKTTVSKQDRRTPKALYDRLDREFRFTHDAAADETNALAGRMIPDALNQFWRPEWRIYCNPPYQQTGKWMRKAASSEALSVLLVQADVTTRWFHAWGRKASEIRMPSGRIRFDGIDCNAPFPSVIVVFRPGAEGPPRFVFWELTRRERGFDC